MSNQNRRGFLAGIAKTAGAAAAFSAFPPAIQRALAIQANNRTGTIQDVEHIVILMQENRSFDHYFGTLNGVRGFADPFPIPVADSEKIIGKTIWSQPNASGPTSRAPVVAPFRVNTITKFDYMRITGTPHSWTDAQYAWDQGRMSKWPVAKGNHAMGFFNREDMPFQYALPMPSRSATPTTARRRPAPTPTACSCGAAATTRWRKPVARPPTTATTGSTRTPPPTTPG